MKRRQPLPLTAPQKLACASSFTRLCSAPVMNHTCLQCHLTRGSGQLRNSQHVKYRENITMSIGVGRKTTATVRSHIDTLPPKLNAHVRCCGMRATRPRVVGSTDSIRRDTYVQKKVAGRAGWVTRHVRPHLTSHVISCRTLCHQHFQYF